MFGFGSGGVSRKRKASEFALVSLIFLIISVPVHEYFHCNVAETLGFSSEVSFSWLGGFTAFDISSTTQTQGFLIGFIGGGGVALLYYIISVVVTSLPITIALRFVGTIQLAYAIPEAFMGAGFIQSEWWLVTGTIIGGGLSIIYFMPKLRKVGGSIFSLRG